MVSFTHLFLELIMSTNGEILFKHIKGKMMMNLKKLNKIINKLKRKKENLNK